MSAQTAALRGAVQAADNDVADWLKGLVTGSGSSPSQVIVSGILSVVPGLGQAMDVRDIVLGVIAISRSPASPMAWLDIAITLVGCVPVAGDSLKTGFRLLKSGHSLPRILDGMSPKIRGNVEKWFREINWAEVASTVKRSFDDVIAAFIDGIDSWLVKTVMGQGEVKLLVAQLKDLRARAPKMLDEAVAELRQMWGKALGDAKPRSTAAASSPLPAKTATHAEVPGTAKRPEPTTVRRDKTATDPAGTRAAKSDERRAAKKKQDWDTGVPAEHIADYWCAKNKRNLKKANNNGRLWEEWDKAGRQGIDHVWVQSGTSARPGVIGETKSTLFGAFRFLQALPEEIRQQLKELGEAEAASPTPGGQPNVFHSAGRDGLQSKTRVDGTSENEEAMKKGLGKPNPNTGLMTQMSHEWIANAIHSEDLTKAGRELAQLIRSYRKRYALGTDSSPPYARWIIMVTGRQKHLHETRQGHQHVIQPPLIALPDNILLR